MNILDKSEKSELEIIEINSEKIIFKTTHAWAFCLNASQTNKNKYYLLPFNFLNYQKLTKIVPSYNFPPLTPNSLSTCPSNFQLRIYQQEDVNFLSQLQSGAIFSEMRTGKTPTALMTFQK